MKARDPRPIRVCGDIAYVPLTRGYEAIIDAADVPLVEGWNWHAKICRYTVYAARNCKRGAGPRKKILMHRVIADTPDGLFADHRDGNGLNNRRGNLRSATHQQNTQNCRTRKDNRVGLKGVAPSSVPNKWVARIVWRGKLRHLGTFDAPEKAHEAYCTASATLHGEFARAE